MLEIKIMEGLAVIGYDKVKNMITGMSRWRRGKQGNNRSARN